MTLENFANIALIYLCINIALILIYFIAMNYYQLKIFKYLKKNKPDIYENLVSYDNLMEIFKFKKIIYLFNKKDLIMKH